MAAGEEAEEDQPRRSLTGVLRRAAFWRRRPGSTARLNVRVLLQEQPHEAVPREILVSAAIGSGAAWLIGVFVVGRDFWINILASIALLGPGLWITNRYIERWRRQRAWALPEQFLTSESERLCELIRTEVVKPITALLDELAVDVPRVREVTVFNAASAAMRQLLYLGDEVDLVRDAAARQLRVRRDRGLEWSELEFDGWPEMLETLDLTVARLGRELRTAEMELSLFQLKKAVDEMQLMYPSGEDEGDWYTFEQALRLPHAPREIGSMLGASVVMCTHAWRLVMSVVTAISEREAAR